MTEQPDDGKALDRITPAYAATMPAPQGGALPTGLEWQALERMAHTLADSDVIPYRLKRKPADVAVILLAAREYGIPPLMALSKLPVVNGTPAPMGELMVALVLRAGHYIAAEFYEPDGTRYAGGPITPQHYGEARYKRRDWPEPETLRFTLAEALNAGLVERINNGRAIARDNKDQPTPWESYTPNMARWRAVANACRLAFADVLMGLSYLPEELGAIVDAEGAPVAGDVEFVPPRDAPTGTLEQRTAQEAADRLAVGPYPDEVLDKVRQHAADNGYLLASVTYAGEAMTLDEAIARHVADRQHADTVDAVVVNVKSAQDYADDLAAGNVNLTDDEVAEVRRMADEAITFRGNPMTLGGAVALVRAELTEAAKRAGAQTPEAPQETPSAPPAAEEAAPEAPTPPPPSSAREETPEDVALDVAHAALACDVVDTIGGFYRDAHEDLRALNVAEALTDDDLATLGFNPEEVRGVPLPLGTLLFKVGDYVKRHGSAVRTIGGAGVDRSEEEDTPLDPWAADAAAGWPNHQRDPE